MRLLVVGGDPGITKVLDGHGAREFLEPRFKLRKFARPVQTVAEHSADRHPLTFLVGEQLPQAVTAVPQQVAGVDIDLDQCARHDQERLVRTCCGAGQRVLEVFGIIGDAR
jgi:hypothetical protein